MKVSALSVLVASRATGSAAAGPDTHCSSDEEILFSCAIAGSKKVASLCGGPKDHDISWVQYRSGVIGHPEMVYPKNAQGSTGKFFGHFEDHWAIVGFIMRQVWFKVGSYRYLIAVNTRCAQCPEVVTPPENADQVETQEIVVYKGWRPSAKFQCVGAPIGDLYRVAGRIPDAHDEFYDQK
jgi:hypothetical protein